MGKDAPPSSNQLRKGRWSQPGQVYLVTTVTQGREPVFQDFEHARALIGVMREEARRGSNQALAYVLMPDHLHWLLQLEQSSLPALIGRVKSLSARRIGRPVWQDGFHDRAVRSDEDLRSMARYVVANPVRAGLVRSVRDYPHWDAVWL